MKWITSKRKKSHLEGLVGIYETPTGISVAYGISTGTEATIKAWAIKAAETQTEKQETLIRFAAEYQLQGVPCCYVLSNNEYSLNLVEAPMVAKEELGRALHWVLKDSLNFPAQEAVFDAFELPFLRAKDSTKMIYAAVIRESIMHKIHNFVIPSGLLLQAIDIPELVLRNIIKLYKESANGVIFLQLVQNGGKLIIYKGEDLCIARSFDINFDNLTLESKSLELLVLELQRAADYMSNVFRQTAPNAVVLAPTPLDKDILVNFLKKSFSAEVNILKLSELFKLEHPLPEEQEPECLLAVGATVREGLTI